MWPWLRQAGDQETRPVPKPVPWRFRPRATSHAQRQPVEMKAARVAAVAALVGALLGALGAGIPTFITSQAQIAAEALRAERGQQREAYVQLIAAELAIRRSYTAYRDVVYPPHQAPGIPAADVDIFQSLSTFAADLSELEESAAKVILVGSQEASILAQDVTGTTESPRSS